MLSTLLSCTLLCGQPALPGVVFGDSFGFMSEYGDSVLLKVSLAAQPASEVVIGMKVNDSTEAFADPPELYFNHNNWWVPQSVSVIGVDDDEADGHQPVEVSSFSVSTTDPAYINVQHASTVFTNYGKDAPAAIEVGPVLGEVTEAGGMAKFRIIPNAIPRTSLRLSITSSNPQEASVSPSSIDIASWEFGQPRWVEVHGIDDSALDGDTSFTVTITVDMDGTNDERYTVLAPVVVQLANKDDEEPPYVGCFKDAQHTIMRHTSSSSAMTVLMCVAECRTEGLRYAGLQYGRQCFCGDDYGSARLHDSRCDMPCSGDATQFCGAGFTNSVYAAYLFEGTNAPAVSRTRVGCYKDSLSRLLPVLKGRSSRQHVDLCIGDCFAAGHTYAGLENGNECWCGDDLAGQYALDARCNVACAGNTAESCGGPWHIEVFTTTVQPVTPVPAVVPTHVGCFNDKSSRAMEHYAFSSSTMTVGTCTDECRRRGYLYAGLQYSWQCFCGNTYDVYGAATGCTSTCGGDSSETCGGAWRNSVYTTN